jgi:tetratricopeptide (TPR) repeat protein
MNAIRLSEELPKEEEFDHYGFRASCYARLSGALGKLGLHDEVLKVATAATAFFDKVGWLYPTERPKWLMVLVNKGSALACLGRPREALECLTRVKEMIADNEATIPGNRQWIQQLNQNIDSVRRMIEHEKAGKKWWNIFWR